MAGGALSVWNTFAELDGAWGCHGSGGLQDRTTCIFLVYKLLSQDTACQIPHLAWTTKCANLQCVAEPTLHFSSHGCIPGQGVCQQSSLGSLSPKIFSPQISAFALLKQGGGRPRMSVCGSWSDGENFLCIRRKFVLALTAICAFTAWVPRQLFFLCWVLCLLLFTLQSPGLYYFFFLTKELPAGVVDHTPSSRHKGQHTLYTTLLLFSILFQH